MYNPNQPIVYRLVSNTLQTVIVLFYVDFVVHEHPAVFKHRKDIMHEQVYKKVPFL